MMWMVQICILYVTAEMHVISDNVMVPVNVSSVNCYYIKVATVSLQFVTKL